MYRGPLIEIFPAEASVCQCVAQQHGRTPTKYLWKYGGGRNWPIEPSTVGRDFIGSNDVALIFPKNS